VKLYLVFYLFGNVFTFTGPMFDGAGSDEARMGVCNGLSKGLHQMIDDQLVKHNGQGKLKNGIEYHSKDVTSACEWRMEDPVVGRR